MPDPQLETPPLPPIGRHHVLHLAYVMPTLPTTLAKSLFLLACSADHRTGRSRPGRQTVVEHWGIPYSTWYRHMTTLAKLGLVRQVVKGNAEAGLAAEYQLLHVRPLTSESAAGVCREGIEHPSPRRGGETIGENGVRRDPPLSAYESELWHVLRTQVVRRLTESEHRRLTEQLPTFDQLTRLRRTAVRLAARGKEREVVEALTRRQRPDTPAYEGARNIPASMWSRLAQLARTRRRHERHRPGRTAG